MKKQAVLSRFFLFETLIADFWIIPNYAEQVLLLLLLSYGITYADATSACSCHPFLTNITIYIHLIYFLFFYAILHFDYYFQLYQKIRRTRLEVERTISSVPVSKCFDRERILVRKSRPLKKKELEHNATSNAARHAKQTTHILST